ncbi:uncharacterized [Tachysurus ichikawai]
MHVPLPNPYGRKDERRINSGGNMRLCLTMGHAPSSKAPSHYMTLVCYRKARVTVFSEFGDSQLFSGDDR